MASRSGSTAFSHSGRTKTKGKDQYGWSLVLRLCSAGEGGQRG
jgi:hypothetical protein